MPTIPRLLILSSFLCVAAPTTASALQNARSGERTPDGLEEVEEAILALLHAAQDFVSDLEEASNYEATMLCPNGETFRRARAWDVETLRSTAVRPIEEDLLSQCDLPEGLSEGEAAWWVAPARQTYACSGPFGSELSRWSENWEFLQDACVVHDICYRSAMEKDSCDSNFKENVRTLCWNPGLIDRLIAGLCEAGVDSAFEIFGHPGFSDAFENGQAELRRRLRTASPSKS